MKQKRVVEIVIPYKKDLPLHPSVALYDRIIAAVELMINNNLTQIAVVHNGRSVGVIRLKDAFKKLGIQVDLTKKDKTTVNPNKTF